MTDHNDHDIDVDWNDVVEFADAHVIVTAHCNDCEVLCHATFDRVAVEEA